MHSIKIKYQNLFNMIIFPAILFGLLSIGCATDQQEERVTEMVPTEVTIPLVNEDVSLKELVEKNNIKIEDLSVLIDKSDYTLTFIDHDTIVKMFPVVLGYNPVGDKMQEGDYKTPEGVFGIRDKYPHKSWKYFIWIDYPNAESWKRFEQRKKDGTIDKSAKIGGEVGIHGTPEGCDHYIDNKANWTFGCISLKRTHIEEIYPYFHKKIQITIQA